MLCYHHIFKLHWKKLTYLSWRSKADWKNSAKLQTWFSIIYFDFFFAFTLNMPSNLFFSHSLMQTNNGECNQCLIQDWTISLGKSHVYWSWTHHEYNHSNQFSRSDSTEAKGNEFQKKLVTLSIMHWRWLFFDKHFLWILSDLVKMWFTYA